MAAPRQVLAGTTCLLTRRCSERRFFLRPSAIEDAAATELKKKGRTFLGAVGVMAQKPTSRPAPGEPRRALNPRVACKAKWKRIEALQRLHSIERFSETGTLALE